MVIKMKLKVKLDKRILILLIFTVLYSLNVNALNVTLEIPTNSQLFLNSNDITFNCSANTQFGISNISLYHDINGTFYLNQTKRYGYEIYPELESGLVLLMHFNNDSNYGENDSIVYDFSGNGNDGTIINVSYTSTGGKFNGAFDFRDTWSSNSPTNESIEVADSNSLDLSTTGTIETWVKPIIPLQNNYWNILSKGDDYTTYSPYALTMRGSPTPSQGCKIALFISDGPESFMEIQTPQKTLVCDGSVWYHIVATWNGTDVKIYLNGILNSTTSQTKIPYNHEGPLMIGKNTQQEIGFDGVIDEIALYNRTLSADEIREHSGYLPNDTSTWWNLNNIVDRANYKWNCLAYNNESDSNYSFMNFSFEMDSSPPLFEIIENIPNNEDAIDPGDLINVTVNISDINNISTVVLQYKHQTASQLINITMSNTTGDLSNTSFNASFTVNVNGNWTYKIFANTTNNQFNTSSETNLSVEFDYTWDATPSFGTTTADLSETEHIGNITINNTGDFTLNFDLSDNSPNGIIYNITEPFDIPSGEKRTISVNATFSNSVREDDIIITIDATTPQANPSLRNTTATLISSSGGAYLRTTIDSFPTSITQSESISVIASAINVGNDTANNVNLTWTFPVEWTNTSGNLSQRLTSLSVDSTITSNVTFTVPSSTPAGSHIIYANATCSDPFEGCNRSASLAITISCSNTDGACGIGCTSASDSDCPAPVAEGASAAGGGGAKGGAVPSVIEFSKIVEIVRGEEDSFNIEVKNIYRSVTLTDLKLSLVGFPLHYIDISPEIIKFIKTGESENFSIKLKIPSYKGYEEFVLNVTIKGTIVSETATTSYTEKQHIKLIVQEISQEESNLTLIEAEKAINLMKEQGFNVNDIKIILKQAKEKLTNKRNKESQDLAQYIIETKEKAFNTYNLINKIKEVLKNPRKITLLTSYATKEFTNYKKDEFFSGPIITGNAIFKTSAVEDVLNLAIAAFERGDYNLAEERTKSAQVLLLLERKGNFLLFLYLYWDFILFVTVIFSIAGVIGYRTYQKTNITKKIQDINKEEQNITKLMQNAQKEYFTGKTSSTDYNKIMDQHKKRIAQLKKTKLNLRSKRIKILKPQQVSKDLEKEIIQVESEIKNSQEQYYKEKKISKDEYNLRFEMLNERLAEIEGERITLQFLKKEVKK